MEKKRKRQLREAIMSYHRSFPTRRFYRSRNNAMLGGVCAGVADYFGFNLRVTRLLTLIALLFAMPITLLIYFGVVLLVPTKPVDENWDDYDPEFRRALRAEPRRTMGDVRRRFQAMESKLARIERYVTSSRFRLDQEFRKL